MPEQKPTQVEENKATNELKTAQINTTEEEQQKSDPNADLPTQPEREKIIVNQINGLSREEPIKNVITDDEIIDTKINKIVDPVKDAVQLIAKKSTTSVKELLKLNEKNIKSDESKQLPNQPKESSNKYDSPAILTCTNSKLFHKDSDITEIASPPVQVKNIDSKEPAFHRSHKSTKSEAHQGIKVIKKFILASNLKNVEPSIICKIKSPEAPIVSRIERHSRYNNIETNANEMYKSTDFYASNRSNRVQFNASLNTSQQLNSKLKDISELGSELFSPREEEIKEKPKIKAVSHAPQYKAHLSLLQKNANSLRASNPCPLKDQKEKKDNFDNNWDE